MFDERLHAERDQIARCLVAGHQKQEREIEKVPIGEPFAVDLGLSKTNLEQVVRVCRRIAVLNAGEIVSDGIPSQVIWWRHTQALNANKKTKEAREALDRAYDFLLESIQNIRDSLSKMAAGMGAIIDSEFALQDFEKGLARLEGRQVFGKVILNF